MTSSWRPRRPQASQPSPASVTESFDNSTLDGDAHYYTTAQLGLLLVELCSPETSDTFEAAPSTTMRELCSWWQHRNKVKYDLCISTPYSAVDLERTLAYIVMARRIDFEPWDADSDIVFSVAPLNHPSSQTDSDGQSQDGMFRILIRGVDGSLVKWEATARFSLSLLAEGYAWKTSNGGRHKAYRFVYAGRLLDPRSEVGDIAPVGMNQFEILAVVDETASLPGTSPL